MRSRIRAKIAHVCGLIKHPSPQFVRRISPLFMHSSIHSLSEKQTAAELVFDRANKDERYLRFCAFVKIAACAIFATGNNR